MRVALSFDSDHETNELRDGGKSIGRMAGDSHGNRVGVPSICELLARHVRCQGDILRAGGRVHCSIRTSSGASVAEGHEIGIHGWIHELNSVLPYEAERDLMMRSADTLENIDRRAPGRHAHAVVGFQRQHARASPRRLGLLYDSSLMADEDCTNCCSTASRPA